MDYSKLDNDYGLEGKVAIIAGGGGPLAQRPEDAVTNGRGAAIMLARAGAKVCVVGLSKGPAQQTADMIVQEGGEAFAISGDLTREEVCRSVVEQTMDRYGRVDCLDNNVGIHDSADVTKISFERWREIFDHNIHSMMLMCKYAIPATVESGDGGAIVNIGSLRAIRPQASAVHTVPRAR